MENRMKNAATSPAGHLARGIDLLVGLPVLILLFPVMLLRAVSALVSSGRVFDYTPLHGLDTRGFLALDFAGPSAGASLARWLNVLSGDLALGGPAPADPEVVARLLRDVPERFSVRPGLVTVGGVRRQLGMAGASEDDGDREFARRHGATSAVTLATRGALAWLLAGNTDRPAAPTLQLLGVTLDNTSMATAVQWLVGRAAAGARVRAGFANPDCLNIAVRDRTYRRALAEADRIFADGIGIRIAARLTGQRMADNVNGTDMFPLLCQAAAAACQPVYLLGGQPGVAAATAEWARARCPGLVIAGTRDGYFDEAETGRVIDEINGSGARILLVGLGAPRQDTWLHANQDRLSMPVRMGVGGLFDYYSGRIPRAPAWIRELGMEWVWRLACEPGRLWRRYLVGNPLFLGRVLLAQFRQDVASAPAHAIGVDSSWRRHLATTRLHLLNRLPGARLAMDRAAKRLLDISASLCGILLAAPLLGLVALSIKLESPGPVIFRQRRVGRDGREFMMLKFRSMFTDAEQRLEALLAQNEMHGGVIFKMRDDPRVTRVGRFIRRTSIDELPQLFNVLRGDMSLVGPRPPLPREVALYSLYDRGRLDAEPGITCIWQVSGRSSIPFERQVEMDLDYIHARSLMQDIKLLLRTVPALLLGRGAY
jgi:exopolysaccharide biosynthesis WecB/TagA/CpsF family protein